MNHEDRLATLERRGYTRRQAEFLCLVLLHSGYFLRRQHAAFFRIQDGSCTTDFVQGLARRCLATRQVFDRQTQLVQLSSASLFDAIGEPDSRLRRAAQPDVVTKRLMTLDVLIACREMPCLATEAEKVAFFTEVFEVPEEDLPGRTYHSDKPGIPPTTRHFVDRVPVLLGAHDTTFVYVLGWAPLGVFASFLNDYEPLLRRLPRAAIRFCSPDEHVIRRAIRMFERRFGTRNVPATADVLAHFEARRRFEMRQFRSFTEQQLERLRHDLHRFAGPAFDAWYERWKREGAAAEPSLELTDVSNPRASGVLFIPHLLTERYPFSGRILEAA